MSNTVSKNKPLTAIVIGAGQRGKTYAGYAEHFPDKIKIVAVADPREFHANLLKTKHNIADKYVFKDWKEVIELEKFADCVIITTTDQLHKEPAVAFAKKGYHILLEKPMAVTAEDCIEIVKTVKENDVLLVVGHVLRYIMWSLKIKEIIDSGALGEIVNIQHTEPIGFWHFAHSFVRGNWHNEADSSCSLLAKCCHDIDLIYYWMGDLKCENVSSFGHLSHFTRENKPKDAAERCMDCPAHVENNCAYSAKRIYLDMVKSGHTGWPVNVVSDIPDIENLTKALKTGPYGKCVYQNDNDVMSQQVVNFQFTGGATATLTMIAFTKGICARATNIYGTKGELKFDDAKSNEIHVFDFLTGQTCKFML
ncbi:hypothetical protein LOTGIDRAFT_130783 [Lottia gigantea]|uniref:Gfo/Idh/MocA-like oxidoreductase N-terminal domain-containing protein n=1 Tax=Lottia gigantea TaxID=225164 RepID=V3ZW86_LOTGI|nr:hypothetical protein LOTGIDRAFT_130783 [Lottia gigantea]ESO85221.1 hypothetical protein LOTGIDRAFT_130783 [Lottia gigantea]